MSKLLEEFEDESFQSRTKFSSFYLKIIALIAVIVGFGIYVGDMLFGKSSLDVLLNLQEMKQRYVRGVEKLKEQNAILQKEYFELKDLDPDSEVK